MTNGTHILFETLGNLVLVITCDVILYETLFMDVPLLYFVLQIKWKLQKQSILNKTLLVYGQFHK